MSGRVTGREQSIKLEFAKHGFPRLEQVFWWCGLRDVQAPFCANRGDVRVLLERVLVNPDRNLERLTHGLNRADVIEMRMGQNDGARFGFARLDHAEDLTGIVAWIDQHACTRIRANQVTILLELTGFQAQDARASKCKFLPGPQARSALPGCLPGSLI